MANGLVDYLNDLRYVEVSNAGASTIPAFGLMRVTGASTTSGLVLTVDQPNADGQDVLINGPTPIIAGGRGVATYETPSQIYYDTGDGTPANGETWGAGNGTYKLKKNKAGFTIQGGAANELVVAVREDQVNGAGTISSVPGCGLQADGSTWTVNTTDLVSGAYGLESLESCEIGVKLGCGLEFDESGNVQVKNTDMIGDGLTIGSGCELAAKLGCGLEFGDESEIKFNASDVVDGNYGLTTTGPCGIVAKLGCGMTFGANGSLNVASADLASGTLGGILAGTQGCELNIDTAVYSTTTAGSVLISSELGLDNCIVTLTQAESNVLVKKNARGVVLDVSFSAPEITLQTIDLCLCDCAAPTCVLVTEGCYWPTTIAATLTFQTVGGVEGCDGFAMDSPGIFSYDAGNSWWKGTFLFGPPGSCELDIYIRYNGMAFEISLDSITWYDETIVVTACNSVEIVSGLVVECGGCEWYFFAEFTIPECTP